MYNNDLSLKKNQPVSKIKVALVDDHPVPRLGSAKIINEYEEYEVIIQANNGAEFLKELKVSPLPDIVLLDIRMPVMDGFKTARWLTNNHPDINIIVHTAFDTELMIRSMVQLGIRAFLSKEAEPRELKYVLDAIVSHGCYYPRDVSNKMADILKELGEKEKERERKNKEANGKKKFSSSAVMFSETELEFLRWVSSDLTYEQIAKQMNVSHRTVENYVLSVCEKLDISNRRLELAVFALKNGIYYF